MHATEWVLGAFVLGLVGVGSTAQAQARGPCAADMARLCGDVQPGGGRLIACMKAHQNGLSPACQARRAKMQARMQEMKQACSQDLQQFCSDIKPGQGRLMACLWAHGPDLSSTCRAERQKLRAQRRQRRRLMRQVRTACRADRRRLCGDVQPGGGRIIECMKAHQNELSQACLDARSRLQAR